jgi:hypothetical protein
MNFRHPNWLFHPLMLLSGVTALLGMGAVWAWFWLNEATAWLPSPRSNAGKDLLYHYNRTSHDIALTLLLIVVISLLWRSRPKNRTVKLTPWWEQSCRFAKEHPLVLALFIAYTIAMVNGSSWLYPELVAWYDGIIDNQLLDNFSIRFEFIAETMLRNDYRFFPLAHQDLHILSWFTPYIKVWMIISAAELFAIIIISSRFIGKLCGNSSTKYLLIIISLLFLSAPSTGFAFFQLIYSERILTLLFSIYILFYYRYQQNKNIGDRNITLATALIGMFVKDIGILLFIVPPIFQLGFGSLGLLDSYPKCQWIQSSWRERRQWIKAYDLELWLCSFILFFGIAFIYLTLLPSIYHNSGSYKMDNAGGLDLDPRSLFLVGFILVRLMLTAIRHVKYNFLDCLNIAALCYIIALYKIIGYEGNSYTSLPVQLIAVLDIAFVWQCCIATNWPTSRRNQIALGLAATTSCLSLIGLEHKLGNNFIKTVGKIKSKQDSWHQTFNKVDHLTKEAKINGEDVNLIFTKSWFRRKRHLDRFKYDRLIFFNPTDKSYTVVDGINSGDSYTPKTGDFLINIDRGNTDFLGDELKKYNEVYRYSPRKSNGWIYRFN